MHEHIKDWTQISIWFIAIVGSAVAVVRYFFESRIIRRQREREFRWQQAKMARELLHEIHQHALAQSATRMLDFSEGQAVYHIHGQPVLIAYGEVLAALNKPQQEMTTEKEMYVRECIDWFFYFIDRLENYIRIELIDYSGVQSVFRPYARKIQAHREVYEKILKAQDYDLARAFLGRYENDPAPNGPNPTRP